MKNKSVHDIISLFWGKHFGKEANMRFRFWFRLEEEEAEKEKELQQIWEISSGKVTERTWKNLSDIEERISQSQKPIRMYHKKWLQYAAVLLLMIASSLTTWWISSPDKADPVSWTECFVPYGENQEIELPDGSRVWINAGSLLVYPETFTGAEREVYLTGEARFEVEKKPEQPFIVRTQQLDIEALGTVFNVQAYSTRRRIVATLEEGSVRISSAQAGFQPVLLQPDQQLIFSRKDKKNVIKQVDATEAGSWKDGYLLFDECSFDEIVTGLERKFNIAIEYNQQKYEGSYYNLKFAPHETLDDALLVLSHLVKGLKYKITEDILFIH